MLGSCGWLAYTSIIYVPALAVYATSTTAIFTAFECVHIENIATPTAIPKPKPPPPDCLAITDLPTPFSGLTAMNGLDRLVEWVVQKREKKSGHDRSKQKYLFLGVTEIHLSISYRLDEEHWSGLFADVA